MKPLEKAFNYFSSIIVVFCFEKYIYISANSVCVYIYHKKTPISFSLEEAQHFSVINPSL